MKLSELEPAARQFRRTMWELRIRALAVHHPGPARPRPGRAVFMWPEWVRVGQREFRTMTFAWQEYPGRALPAPHLGAQGWKPGWSELVKPNVHSPNRLRTYRRPLVPRPAFRGYRFVLWWWQAHHQRHPIVHPVRQARKVS